MDASFWHQKWEQNDIAFHESVANPLLVEHIDRLALADGDRIFLPLCGKTLDLGWLLARGFRVVGVELSPIAVGELFRGLGVEPEITIAGQLTHYRAENIDLFVGDVFELSQPLLGPVAAIYDRAALVALPEEQRARYAAHLIAITDRAPQLLICFEYDPAQMAGPPFSIPDPEVDRHYGATYDCTLLASVAVAGGLKGKCAAQEKVWWLAKPPSASSSNRS